MNKGDQAVVSCWESPSLPDIELLHARYVTHSFSKHAHDEFAIGVIYSGAQALTYQRSEHLLMPQGSIAAINPGEVHTGYAADPEEGWTYRMLYPEPDVLQHIASEITGRDILPFFPHPVILDSPLAERIYRMHCALASSTTPAIEQEASLISVFSQLIVRHAENRIVLQPTKPAELRMHQVRDYLNENYRENVSLSELAALTDLSKFHICRVFGELFGLPPHAYLNLVRIRYAKRLIAKGLPIAQVAADVGFFDQTHLTKRFKAVVGVTPSQYAKGTTRTY